MREPRVLSTDDVDGGRIHPANREGIGSGGSGAHRVYRAAATARHRMQHHPMPAQRAPRDTIAHRAPFDAHFLRGVRVARQRDTCEQRQDQAGPTA